MIKTITTILILFFISKILLADEPNVPTQNLRGKIVNFATQQPIPAATITVLNTKYGAITRNDGYFEIKNLPIGRYIVRFSSIGFETYQMPIVLTSGKEEIINIALKESYIELEEIQITSEKNSFKPINESSIVSSTVFTIDDVERFAGSRMDPARMAQNFAGVVGANDVRNDIIIRGGSPTELLWRIDGLDVPNPNHFATQGATGGPVSAINSNLLQNSDFLIGAWSSEYGDKISGVFDLKTRKGNDKKFEYLAQFGFNGLELGTEGPLPGKNNSFIANYRYAFLDLLEKMGVDFGFSGIPRYQDGILKIDLNATDNHQISMTSMLGISSINIAPSTIEDTYQTDYQIFNGTDFYIIGINWQQLFGLKSYGILTTGIVNNVYKNDLDTVFVQNNEIKNIPYFKSKSTEGYYTIKYSFHYAPNTKHYITSGLENRFRYYNLYGEVVKPNEPDPWLMKEKGNANQILSYINWNWKITQNITTNTGIFAQYLGINDKISIEPRFAASWKFLPLQNLSLGFGIYRQSLPLLLYFTANDNDKLDFIQSIHYVIGYSYLLNDDAIIKLEAYNKDISQVPVDREKQNYWSFSNSGADFGVVSGIGLKAQSTGKAQSYGIDFSLIKNFNNHYYFMLTTSYIRQKYLASDKKWRFGAFDNIFVGNLLAGYEFIISPTFTIEISGKYTIAGGTPYIPIDLEKSKNEHTTKFDELNAYTKRKPNFSRMDLRIDFRNNFENFAIISYISSENLFNSKNIYDYKYNNNTQQIEPIYQLGFFFVGGIKIEF